MPFSATPSHSTLALFYERAQLAPYELTHVRPSPPQPLTITRRLCGWLGASGTQDLRALRLCTGRAAGSGAHSRGAAWMLRQGVACSGALLRTANILTAWPGRVAQGRHQERVARVV